MDSTWVIGSLMGIVLSLIGVVYKKHEKDIDNLWKKLEDTNASISNKADKDSVTENLKNFSEQVQLFRKEIIEEIHNIADSIHEVNTEMLKELGKRPTREEMTAYYQQRKLGK